MKKIFTIVALACALGQTAEGQYYQQSPKFAPGWLGAGAKSGRSVSMASDASSMVVGAPGGIGATGAAVICNRSGSLWSQGATLVGSGAAGTCNQGYSVSMSADGSTVVSGGVNDNGNVGAAWVFTKIGTSWVQMGSKLVGTGYTGSSYQGQAVAISGDGNTIAVGGPGDNNNIGAIWVFARSGGTWVQQGVKLVGSGGFNRSGQGWSVALSYDGNTLMAGAPFDVSWGSAWVFTRSGSTWSQQALIHPSNGTMPEFGSSVSLSLDGNTAAIGVPGYSNKGGAVIFTRSGSVWSQGSTLVSGTLSVGNQQQGESVAISAAGDRMVVGGGAYMYSTSSANIGAGAAWVFKKTASGWEQDYSKYIGTGAVGNSQQGAGVTMSADGNTFIVGGPGDDNFYGAAWVFSTSIPATSTPPSTYVSSLVQDAGISLYPNPASDRVTINIEGLTGSNNVVTITDQAGRVVLSVPVPAGAKVYDISIGELATGTYICTVATDGVAAFKTVFVKN